MYCRHLTRSRPFVNGENQVTNSCRATLAWHIAFRDQDDPADTVRWKGRTIHPPLSRRPVGHERLIFFYQENNKLEEAERMTNHTLNQGAIIFLLVLLYTHGAIALA